MQFSTSHDKERQKRFTWHSFENDCLSAGILLALDKHHLQILLFHTQGKTGAGRERTARAAEAERKGTAEAAQVRARESSGMWLLRKEQAVKWFYHPEMLKQVMV